MVLQLLVAKNRKMQLKLTVFASAIFFLQTKVYKQSLHNRVYPKRVSIYKKGQPLWLAVDFDMFRCKEKTDTRSDVRFCWSG